MELADANIDGNRRDRPRMTHKTSKKKTKAKNQQQSCCDDHHDHDHGHDHDHHHELIDSAAELLADDEDDQCHCCHCGAGQDDLRSRSYLRMREHLQLRLREKHSHNHGSVSSQDSSPSSGKFSGASALNGTEGIDDLVEYINGSQTGKSHQPNPKKAAKKARQKQRKLDEKLAAEAEAARLEAAKAKEGQKKKAQSKKASTQEPSKVAKDNRVPNGMVRITHNPLTNSAVITPLYGPLEPSVPSYLQPSLPHSLPPRPVPELPKPTPTPTPTQTSPPPPPASVGSSSGQQMVTIRRVMGSTSEPVVTVTLKGQTPEAPDRVLFTLVNGQVLSNGDKAAPTTGSAAASAPTAQSAPATPAAPLSRKKQKKKEKKVLKRQQQQQQYQQQQYLQQQQYQQQYQYQFQQQPQYQHPGMVMNGSSNSCDQDQQAFHRLPQEVPMPSFRPSMPPQRSSHDPVELFPSNASDFNLDNFRLPPGITLTRVQHGTPPPHHPQLPMRLIQSTSPPKASGGSSPIIMTSPLTSSQGNVPSSVPKAKDGSLSASNVIVVDTRNIPSGQQQPPRMQSVAVQTGEDDDLPPSGASLPTKKQLKRQRRKERLQLEQQMAAMQLSAQKAPEAKKKSKKKGARSAGHSTSAAGDDKWEENIFAPKSDLDLERGDMDDDERELEAFKRFCFNTVPPERKEKVRIQLNVKDIFGKTKSSASSSCSSGSSSCKSSS